MTMQRSTSLVHGVAELAPWLAAGDGDILVVIDQALAGTPVHREVRAAVRRSGAEAATHAVTHHSRLPAVLTLADRIGQHTAVVVVGGGGAVDQAKLATLVAGDRHLERVLLRSHRCGLVALPLGARRRNRFATVLTTVGTGTHVSPNACLEVDGRKRLFNSPALRPDLSVIDSVATETLPGWLFLEGVLENLIRLAGVYVGSSEDVCYPSDSDIEGLARALVAIGYEAGSIIASGGTPPAGLRRELATLSGRTHCSDLAAGRENYVDKSWPLGHELSASLGLRKVQAMSSILVPMWARIEAGQCGFGNHARLHRFWSRAVLPVRPRLGQRPSAGLGRLMDDWGVDTHGPALAVHRSGAAVPEEAARLAASTWQSWGHRLPMLRGITAEHVRSLYADCLSAQPPAVGHLGDVTGLRGATGAAMRVPTPARGLVPGLDLPVADRQPVPTSSAGRR